MVIITAPIKGPTYGIKFNKAHRKAITTALFIPKIKSIIVYEINKIVICKINPMKYLDNKSLIVSKDLANLFFVLPGTSIKRPFFKILLLNLLF